MFVYALKQYIDKKNKYINILDKYKKSELHMKTKTFEDFIKENPKVDNVVIEVKIDGELTALVKKGNKVELYSRSGRVRTETPLTEEFKEFPHDGVFIGELYALSETGGPQTYAKSLSLLRAPKTIEDEDRYRISLFDFLEFDGNKVIGNYRERFFQLNFIIGNKFKHIHVAPYREGTIEDVIQMWKKWVINEKWEGLVVRVNETLYKIKRFFPIDLAVVGVTMNKSYPDQIGALITAFMLPNNTFLLSSKVGTGLTDDERREWMTWAKENKILQENNIIWVNPFKDPRIIEVKAEEFMNKKEFPIKFEKDKYIRGETEISSVSMRKPVFQRIRLDKKLSPEELGRDQVPTWSEKYKQIINANKEVFRMKSRVNFKKLTELNLKLASKYGPKAKKVIERKMHKMKYEDIPQEQKAAIAIEEARRKGLKVPPKSSSFVDYVRIARLNWEHEFIIKNSSNFSIDTLNSVLRKIAEIENKSKDYDDAIERMSEQAKIYKEILNQRDPKFREKLTAIDDFISKANNAIWQAKGPVAKEIFSKIRQEFANLLLKINPDLIRKEQKEGSEIENL